jgi:hypothetical protein
MNQKQKISRQPKLVTSSVEKPLQHVAAPELGLVESELGAQRHSQQKRRPSANNVIMQKTCHR